MSHLKRRIDKLEGNQPKQPPIVIRTISEMYGPNGNALEAPTKEELIQRHVEAHPEDAGREFFIINRLIVDPIATGVSQL